MSVNKQKSKASNAALTRLVAMSNHALKLQDDLRDINLLSPSIIESLDKIHHFSEKLKEYVADKTNL